MRRDISSYNFEQIRAAKERVLCCLTGLLTFALTAGAVPTKPVAPTNTPSADKVPCARDLAPIRTTVETLRGKRFKFNVPAFIISERELRSVVDREVEEDYPGVKLEDYQALMIWLDVLPPGSDLKKAEAAFAVDQVAGLYDSDTKEMYIPVFSTPTTNVVKQPARKQIEKFSTFTDDIILAHEFTHALEDQSGHWTTRTL